MNLLVLSHLTDDAGFFGADRRARLACSRRGSRSQGGCAPMMLAALSTYHAGTPQLVITGDPSADDTKALREVVMHRYLPTTIVVPLAPAARAESPSCSRGPRA